MALPSQIAMLADDLPQLLRVLRDAAPGKFRESRLLDWGRKHLKLTPESERPWFERTWWGLAAGMAVHLCLNDPASRSQVMDLFDSFDVSEIEAARNECGGVILAGAHVGPSHGAVHFLLDRRWPLLIWTAKGGLPKWVEDGFGARFFDPLVPTVRPTLLARSALHLRSGGVLFGAPDAPTGNQTITRDLCGATWTFSLGLPTLARRLNVPAFRFFVLWHNDRLRIDCERIPNLPQDLDEASWHSQWIDHHASRVEPLMRTSPENLRFLGLIDDGALRRELGL